MTKIGKLWTDSVAYVALLTGAGLSIAGNVANVVRTRGLDTDTLDIVLAVAFPALVVLMVEVFVSSRWRGLSWPMQTLRWAGCLSIGAVAMRVSWVHLNELMTNRGQTADVATLGPLAIDFLAIMATALILAGRGQVKVLDSPNGWVSTPLANALDTFASGEDLDALVDKWVNAPLAANQQVAAAMSVPAPAMDSESDLFARLEREFAAPDPIVPVSPGPAAPTARTTSGRRARLSQDDSAEAWHLAAQGRANGLSAGEISELLAGHYGVSSRTIRRQGWWVPTMAGKLETDAS